MGIGYNYVKYRVAECVCFLFLVRGWSFWVTIRVSYRIFRLGGGKSRGGISIYEKEGGVMRKRGVGDKSLCQQTCHSSSSKGQRVPITNESSSSIWWAVLGRRGTSAWGGKLLLGGGKSQVSHPPV